LEAKEEVTKVAVIIRWVFPAFPQVCNQNPFVLGFLKIGNVEVNNLLEINLAITLANAIRLVSLMKPLPFLFLIVFCKLRR
jgi:hypothetical protein